MLFAASGGVAYTAAATTLRVSLVDRVILIIRANDNNKVSKSRNNRLVCWIKKGKALYDVLKQTKSRCTNKALCSAILLP